MYVTKSREVDTIVCQFKQVQAMGADSIEMLCNSVTVLNRILIYSFYQICQMFSFNVQMTGRSLYRNYNIFLSKVICSRIFLNGNFLFTEEEK